MKRPKISLKPLCKICRFTKERVFTWTNSRVGYLTVLVVGMSITWLAAGVKGDIGVVLPIICTFLVVAIAWGIASSWWDHRRAEMNSNTQAMNNIRK